MSEAAEIDQTIQKRRATFVIIIAVVIILLLVYGGGLIVLPISIQSNYQNRNCDSALSLHGLYTNIYPVFIQDRTLQDSVTECEMYMLAVNNEVKESWRDSHEAFIAYSETYPNGLFARDAHDRGAATLLELVKEEMSQNQYAEAMGNLNLMMKDYADTSAASEATELFRDLYSGWGAGLRDADDFAAAEKTFDEFTAWAQANSRTEDVTSAQRGLAETYLTWGLALQSQGQFEDAKEKLDLAVSTDPEPRSDSGPAAQAKSNESKFHIEWGDSLIEQQDYPAAIQHYETAITMSEGNDQLMAKDAFANGYLHWAKGLSDEEDFLGALEQVEQAQNNAASNSMKNSVEDARSQTYLAFSQSSGEQAQQAMKDAVKMVCEEHDETGISIFGLDSDHILAGIYGLEQELPENVAAKTPGEMHYVVCVDEVLTKTVQFVDFYGYQMFRIKESWFIRLREADTGRLVEEHVIEGEDPPPLPTNPFEIAQGGKVQTYYGKPDIADLADWLKTELK